MCIVDVGRVMILLGSSKIFVSCFSTCSCDGMQVFASSASESSLTVIVGDGVSIVIVVDDKKLMIIWYLFVWLAWFGLVICLQLRLGLGGFCLVRCVLLLFRFLLSKVLRACGYLILVCGVVVSLLCETSMSLDLGTGRTGRTCFVKEMVFEPGLFILNLNFIILKLLLFKVILFLVLELLLTTTFCLVVIIFIFEAEEILNILNNSDDVAPFFHLKTLERCFFHSNSCLWFDFVLCVLKYLKFMYLN